MSVIREGHRLPRFGDRCWYGGTCRATAVFAVTHGYAAFGLETHPICANHLAPMVASCTRAIPAWGETLPVTVTALKAPAAPKGTGTDVFQAEADEVAS